MISTFLISNKSCTWKFPPPIQKKGKKSNEFWLMVELRSHQTPEVSFNLSEILIFANNLGDDARTLWTLRLSLCRQFFLHKCLLQSCCHHARGSSQWRPQRKLTPCLRRCDKLTFDLDGGTFTEARTCCARRYVSWEARAANWTLEEEEDEEGKEEEEEEDKDEKGKEEEEEGGEEEKRRRKKKQKKKNRQRRRWQRR